MTRALVSTALTASMFVSVACHSVPTREQRVGASGATAPASAPSSAASIPSAAPANDQRWTVFCSGYAEGNDRENCWMRVAAVTKQSSFCARAGTIKGECLTAVARATSDSSACAGGGGTIDVFECVMAAALHAKSASVCAPFEDGAGLEKKCVESGEAKERCAMWRSKTAANALAACRALATGDRAACEALPPRTDSSREACMRGLALRTKDATLCRALRVSGGPQFNPQETSCIADVAIAQQSAAACATIAHGKEYPAGDIDYDACMTAAAVKDKSACDRLSPPERKELAPAARRLCLANARAGVPDTGMSDAFLHWQMAMNDLELCREAPFDDGCLLTVALNTRKKAACEPIANPETKAACATLVAP